MFCRVLENNPERQKQSTSSSFRDAQAIERVKEMERRSVVNNSSTNGSSKTDELERLALQDNLTDLYNSRTFLKELKDEVKRSKRYKRPVSVCSVSVDGLKEINARHGNIGTDTVLGAVASIIRSAIRDVDIPGRYNDQLFAIILPETNGAGAAIVAERIRQLVGMQSIAHNWNNLKVTASVGLASFPSQGREHEELLRNCLKALQQAEDEGGDRVCIA
jgi:two-component system chemotaxis family response regulator WspR